MASAVANSPNWWLIYAAILPSPIMQTRMPYIARNTLLYWSSGGQANTNNTRQKNWLLARAVGVEVGRHSGSRLATMLVVTISVVISPLFFSVVYFSHRGIARIKKPIYHKLMGAPKSLWVDSVGQFGAPGGHFGFLRFHRRNGWIKKLI